MATCVDCGEENPQRARFCLACGTPLAAGPALDEERKVVSILFVDLVGFTAMSERIDPEDVGARLRPYHARSKQEIERFGGTVEKFIGDAVMAAFGAPVAHEDDAERAVRAGLRILEVIDELNQAEPGFGLSVRAGVNTGEAVVALGSKPAEGAGFVTGDVVNTAARLQQVAPVGGLVVGRQTFEATRRVVDYEALGPVSVRGKAEPLLVWRAKRPRLRTGTGSDEGGGRVPFIGRQHELALLKQMFARAVSESSMQLVTLTGEPGAGKSRLVEEFRAILGARQGAFTWRAGRCLPYGEGITFWPLGQVVKAQAHVLDSDNAEEVSQKLAVAVREAAEEASERDWLQARLAPLVGAAAATPVAVERSQSFAAWRRFLEAIASRKPLVLVFEDLHWADDPFLEFVEHLVDWSAGVPLLVVCTARPELFDRRPAWGGGKRNSAMSALSPLTPEETSRLMAALLPRAVLPPGTQQALLQQAGGNPLYAEEFARMLRDRAILGRPGPGGGIAAGAEFPVPQTIQALIAARLDTLAPERKSVLHAAAVVGSVFWAGAVASVSRVPEGTVEDVLHELTAKQFVRRIRITSLQGEAEFSFWHVLVQDVAYRQIPRAARAAMHQAAAEWIGQIAGARATDRAELLAYHYGQALELVRAVGGDTRELEQQATHFLVLAGERALSLDVARAESYYRRALGLLPQGEPERARVLAKLAEAAALAGRRPEAEAGYAEAIAGLRVHGDQVAAGEALVKLATLVRDKGEAVRARSLLAEAVGLLERAPPGPELVLAYTHLARYYHFAGPAEVCLEWAEKATAAAARLGVESLGIGARVFRGYTRFELGDPGGLDDLRKALRTGLELGLGDDTAGAYLALGDVAWWTEGPAAGLEVYGAGIEFTERRGMTYYTMYLKGESVWPLSELGQWDALVRVAGEIREWDPDSYQALLALPYESYVLACRGQLADAAALRDVFLPRARQSSDPQVLIPALATSAVIELSHGASAAAVALIAELEAATRDRPVRRAQHLPDAIRVCAAAGAMDLAETLLERADVSAARQVNAVHAARAVFAEAEGQPELSLRLYEESADRWASYGFVLEQGQATLGAGRCLLALEHAQRAAASFRNARAIFESLGARPLMADTSQLLEQAASLAS